MFELLVEPVEQVAGEGKTLPSLSGGIGFRDVRFRYHEDLPWVLNGVTFDVPKGQTVALVGPSGAGKTTLIDLLPGFYAPTEGDVLIEGRPLSEYDLSAVRQHMAMVTQESILFHDTIFANIAFGKDGATMEEVVRAAKVAQAHDFISATENGYDTIIGDQGVKLSGGQRQRLAIARAVLKDPEILILDEATSALDSESEKLVQQALDNLLEGRTAVVIAHRLSTVRNADRIMVMEAGKVIEAGTHDELMETGGMYQKLVHMQWQVEG